VGLAAVRLHLGDHLVIGAPALPAAHARDLLHDITLLLPGA
jgi:hypothetical protein